MLNSKYIEAFLSNSTNTTSTTNRLRQSFATHELPNVMVSDNATSFTSNEFKTFCENNGVQHITSSPFHPATNGLADQTLRTFKIALKMSKGSIEERLIEFLPMYRITHHSTTNESPSK